MTESGQPFEVSAAGARGERYVLEPVTVYGRADAAGRPVRGSWSTWRYRVKGRPDAHVTAEGPTTLHERPTSFLLDLADGRPERRFHLWLEPATARRVA